MNLRAHMKLCKPRLALEPRPGIAIENMNSFELWLAMSEQGWVCHEYSIEVRKRHKDTAQILREGAVQPVPTYEPYKEGSAKIWRTKPTQKVVFPEYLLCLLQVDKHGKDVTHFQTKGFYRAMLDGKEYTPKARRQGFEFSDKKKWQEASPPEHNRRRVKQIQPQSHHRQRTLQKMRQVMHIRQRTLQKMRQVMTKRWCRQAKLPTTEQTQIRTLMILLAMSPNDRAQARMTRPEHLCLPCPDHLCLPRLEHLCLQAVQLWQVA